MCASAQDAAEPRGVIRIDVTGTNIPRTESEAPLPVEVITREEIERSGATTVADVMARVAANVLNYKDQFSIIDTLGQPGMSSVNLRGIGDGSTLILLNGRRVANYAFNGGTVDVNSIPLAAIDRIEILKDGASAIYGTDAIAGVVNFILRKDYRGIEVAAYGSWTEHEGGDQRQVSLTAGYGDLAQDRFNVFVTASYQKDDSLRATARPFSRTGFIPHEGVEMLQIPTFPANILTPERWLNPSLATGCEPPGSLPTIDPFPGGHQGQPLCGSDAAAFLDILPEVERTGVVGRATFKASDDHRLFVEGNYSNNRFVLRFAPQVTSMFQSPDRTPLLYPSGGPFYPTEFAAANGLTGDLNLFYRTVPLGPRIRSVDTSAWRAVIGADGVARGWDYATALTYSRNDEREHFDSGEVSHSRLLAAMATGLINPFGASGPEGDALLASTQVTGEMHSAEGTTLAFDIRASKAVYSLPAGPIAIALGAEARREKLANLYSPFVTAGDFFFGGDLQSAAGSRTVQALFAEASVPIARGLELQLAARYDHYSDFGDTVNPKIALRWQPVKSLLLRTSWGKGFRAPNLYDLHTPLSRFFAFGFSDPVRCPVTNGPLDCEASFSVAGGGNPNLQPETSEQFNAGVLWEPLPGLSLGADYWRIGKEDTISRLGEDIIFQNFARFAPTNIIRGAVDPAFPDLPGPIETVLVWQQNLGRLRTSGIDVDVKWRGPATRIGRFDVAFDGTYYIEWKAQPDGSDYVSGLGRAQSVAGGPFPRWKHRASLDWSFGPWGATLGQTYQSGYVDSNADRAGNPLPNMRRVAGYDIWDLDARYTGFRNLTLTLGVKNVRDRAPPFTNLQRFPVGFDPTYADPRGRMFYGAFRYAFK